MTDNTGSMHVFTWSMAEELAEGHMRLIGFADARRTAAGRDRGIDVVANSAVAQVKYLTAPVGAPDVQRLRGAAHQHSMQVFYSASGYTRAAVEYAEIAGVALFQFNVASEVWPVNDAAGSLLGRSEDPELSVLAELMFLARETEALLESNAKLHEAINEETTRPGRYEVSDHAEQIRLAEQLSAYLGLLVEQSDLPQQQSLTTAGEQRSFMEAHYSIRERAAALFGLDLSDFPVVWDTTTPEPDSGPLI